MQDVINPLARRVNFFRFRDAGKDELDSVSDSSEVCFFAGREIVQNNDLVTASDQFLNGV
jgi:hypothetical protein